MNRSRKIACLSVILAALCAAPAFGSVVSIDGQGVVLTALNGESNTAWVKQRAPETVAGVSLQSVQVHDQAGLSVPDPLPPTVWDTVPIPGCRITDPVNAVCRAPTISRMTATLGDGPDYFADLAQNSLPASMPVTVDGGDGSDFLKGGSGADTISGGAGTDEIIADDDRDFVRPGGNDVISGGPDEDHIWAGHGQDSVDGGTGPDWLHIKDGEVDNAVCGDGFDEIADWDAVDVIASDCEYYAPA